MKRVRILFLMLSLFAPTLTFAQTSRTANKSWQSFWAQFQIAVNKKDRARVKRLMSSESDFFSGGGGETRDEWLQMLDRNKLWPLVQRSVRLGTVLYSEARRPARITKDRHLIFEFINNRWRFVGVMGD